MPRPDSRPQPQHITSKDNPVVRHLQSVARHRKPGLVLLEGPRVVLEAELAGIPLELLAVREGEQSDAKAAHTVTLSANLFKSISQTETPQGVLAVARAQFCSLPEALDRARATGWPLVVLDGIQDPGNVGAIIRTAAAAGATAVVVLPGTADPFGPKAVRASAGNVFRLAIARAAWEELGGLRGIGASPSGRVLLADAPVDAAEMIVFGSEAHGLRAGSLEMVSIPMAAGVDSLNVAAAAAVVLFEVRRRKGM